MITINNEYYFELAREANLMDMILKEENLQKKASLSGNKILKSLNNVDLTTDSSVEGIYYALSSFFSLSLIMSKSPLPGRMVAKATSKHLNHNVLPKYRKRLMGVYSSKITSISNKIEDLKNDINDDNRGNVEEKIETLDLMKDQLERDYSRIKLIK